MSVTHDSPSAPCCGSAAVPTPASQRGGRPWRLWVYLGLVTGLYLSAVIWAGLGGGDPLGVVLGKDIEPAAEGHGVGVVLVSLWLATAQMLIELMPWWLLGMLIAGALVGLADRPGVAKRLRSGGVGASATAAGAGAAVPICSCGMAPMVAGLVRGGAAVGPAMAFIIAAPMINIPALLLTGGALGGEYAAGRIVATLAMALLAAWLFGRWARRAGGAGGLLKLDGDGVGGRCGVSKGVLECGSTDVSSHSGVERESGSAGEAAPSGAGGEGGVGGIGRRAWGLFLQMNGYLLLAVVMGGAIKVLVPAAWIETLVGGDGPLSVMLAALAASVLYMCTYTEVPTAVALAELGMGPGATLSYLLAGPGMSLPSLLLLSAVLRLRALLAYAAMALLCAVAAGLIFNILMA